MRCALRTRGQRLRLPATGSAQADAIRHLNCRVSGWKPNCKAELHPRNAACLADFRHGPPKVESPRGRNRGTCAMPAEVRLYRLRRFVPTGPLLRERH